MDISKSKFGMSGIVVGTAALLLALISFWAGPFSPQPTIENSIAKKVASIRQATIDAIKGKELNESYTKPRWNIDKVIDVIIPIASVLAIVLGLLGFITKEPVRIVGGAAVLGVSAIAFQFLAMYVMALLFVFLIYAVLTEIDIS